MKFTIFYKFKLKMAQNLSGRSRPVRAGSDRSGPVQGRCQAAFAYSAGLCTRTVNSRTVKNVWLYLKNLC